MRVAAPAALLVALLVVVGCGSPPDEDAAPPPAPAATTTTAAPVPTTTTPAPPPTTQAPVAAVQEFSGGGDDVVQLSPALEFGVLEFACDSCERNVIVESVGSGGDLFVNTIGGYSGAHLVSQPIETVQVQADGDWTLRVGPIDLAEIVSPGQPATGSGDAVLFWASLPEVVEMSHEGERNFVVNVTGAEASDLVVNEIGPYSGTAAWPGGQPGVAEVTADGTWTLTPQS